MSEFVASVEALASASYEFDAPVISGNVSFYNETQNDNIISTPATGMIGLRDSVDNLIPTHFVSAFESVLCIRYHWCESYVYVNEVLQNSSSAFFINSDVKPVQFIELCQSLDAQI